MTERDPAAARWAVIQLVRALGVVAALCGLLVVAGPPGSLRALPDWAGYLLLGVGLADLFLVPLVLARRWRSTPSQGDGE